MACFCLLLLFAVGELRRVGGANTVVWWADGGWTCCATVALGGCLVAAKRDTSSRSAWLFFAAGCASWLGGQLFWDEAQLVAHVAQPFPSVGDVGYLGCVPLCIAGIVALPRPRDRRTRRSASLFLLDVAIVVLALTLVGVVAAQGLLHTSPTLMMAAKAYPVAYLTLGLVLFLVIVRSPHIVAVRGVALLFVGLACEEFAFVAYTPLALNGSYMDGTALDVAWMAGFLLIALAGFEWRTPQGERIASATPAFTLTLTVMELVPTILGVGVGLIAPGLTRGLVHGPVAGAGYVLMTLVTLRQVMAAVNHARLYGAEAAQRGLAHQRAERLRRVQETSRALHLDLDAAGIGQLTVDVACAALEFRIAALNLITNVDAPSEERRIRSVAAAGLSAEVAAQFLAQDAPASDVLSLLRDEFLLSRSYFLPAERASKAFESTSIPQWTPTLASVVKDGWRAGDELLVPLVERRTGDFLGFLSVDDPIDGRRPDAEVVEILEIFADQAALAIENSRLYERAQAQAMRDAVTDLANHRAVHQALDAALTATVGERREYVEQAAFLLVDVDNFKLFNDTYGHPTGDAVLRTIAGRLRGQAREEDVVGRYGGDEFALVLPGVDRAGAESVARRITTAIAATPYVDACGAMIPLSASIGVAAAPDDGVTRQALLAVADARMYAVKSGATSDPILVRSAADLLGDTTFGILEGLVAAVDAKDRYTREHSLDVTRYALLLADALDLPDGDRRTLAIAGPLHDVGKIAIPDRVLRKPGALTDEEYAAVRAHVTYGVAIVRGLLDDPCVIDTIAQHHERYDGRGYPHGLHGTMTPLLGRIMQIADAVSAMTLDRPYRRGLSPERVVAELRRAAGAQFDPALVEPFIGVFCASWGVPISPTPPTDHAVAHMAGSATLSRAS